MKHALCHPALRRGTAIIVAIIAIAACGSIASAKTISITHGGTYWGTDVLIEPDQVIDGDITVFGGDIVVGGRVNGNVADFGGTVAQMPGSYIEGNVTQYAAPYVSAIAPFAGNAIWAQNERIMERLMFSVIVLLIFLIFPVRVRISLDRLEQHPGLSAAVGTLSLVAILPVALLLLISVIGIPLIPVEIVAVIACAFIGQAALGILVGRRLYELIRPHATPSPLAALIFGLVVLSAAEIVPIVGWMVTLLVIVVGLGAAILGFIRESTFGSPRPTISGPPMPAA